VKRMFSTLPAMGIEFAKEGAAVIVQAAPASPTDVTEAKAAPAPAPALAAAG
jgi:moderate conductance mechanosensitive channel